MHHLRHENVFEDASTIREKGVAETWSTYATNSDDGIVNNIDLAIFGNEMDTMTRKQKFPRVLQHCNNMRKDAVYVEGEFIRGTLQNNLTNDQVIKIILILRCCTLLQS